MNDGGGAGIFAVSKYCQQKRLELLAKKYYTIVSLDNVVTTEAALDGKTYSKTPDEDEDRNSLVWLLQVYTKNDKIMIKGLDLMTLDVCTRVTNYKFSVPLIISKNVMSTFFDALLNLVNHYKIHQIISTNLKLISCCNPLLNVLFNVNVCDKEVAYDLVIIECLTNKDYQTVYRLLHDNQLNRNFYYLSAIHNEHYSILLNILIETYTKDYTTGRVGSGDNTVSLITVDIDQQRMAKELAAAGNGDDLIAPEEEEDDAAAAHRRINAMSFDSIFSPDGIYHFGNNGKLELLTANTASMYKLLPIVSIDIETTAENMIDIPFGVNECELMASLVFFCKYLDTIVIVICYLRCDTGGGGGGAAASSLLIDWKKFDYCLCAKYQQIYAKKYASNVVRVKVESYATMPDFLFGFYSLYMRGNLFSYLNLPNNCMHIVTGHNLIKYDFLVIYTMLQWYQCFDIINEVSFTRLANSAVPFINFHPNAICIDTLVLFQEVKLYYGSLSLRAISKFFIKHETKMDLNSIIIRVPYLLAKYLARRSHENTESVNCLRDTFKTFIRNWMRITYEDSEEKATMAYKPAQLSLQKMPMDLREVLSNKNLDMSRLEVPTIAEMLHYNIRDTECVLNILEKIDIRNLLHEYANKFCTNPENSIQDNVSNRMRNMFALESLKWGQLFTTAGCEDSIGTADGGGGGGGGGLSVNPTQFDKRKFKLEGLTKDNLMMAHSAIVKTFVAPTPNSSVVCKTELLSNQKKFIGAAVGTRSGIFANVLSLDVASMYPTIIWQKRLYNDSCSCCSVGQLKRLLANESSPKAIIRRMVVEGTLKIFLAEDCNTLSTRMPEPGKRKIAANYLTFVDKWKLTYNVAAESNNFVGQMLLTVDELYNLPDAVNLIVTTIDSNSYIQNFIPLSLSSRRHIKRSIKKLQKLETRNYDRERILDGKQLSKKIDINSVYGMFGNSFPPVSAATTLYGRKIIVCGMKVLYVMVLETLLAIERGQPQRLLPNYDELEQASSRELLTRAGVRLSSVDDIDDLLKYYYTVAVLHGLDDPWEIKKILEQTPRCEEAALENFKTKLSGMRLNIESVVVDFDTDGLQIVNQFNLNVEYLQNKFGTAMKRIMGMPVLEFEPKINKLLLILARKKYSIYKSGPIITDDESYAYYVRQWIPLNSVSISHSGYERNALPPIKYICNVIAGMTFLNFYPQKLANVLTLEAAVEGIYSYLHRHLKKEELYLNIALKRLKPNCVRKTFIEKYATNYQGSLNAVFTVNRSAITNEELCLFDDYCLNPDNYSLHYGYFLRNYLKVWVVQLSHAGVKVSPTYTGKSDPTALSKYLHLEIFSKWFKECVVAGGDGGGGAESNNLVYQCLTNNKLYIV